MTHFDDDQISARLHAALDPLTQPLGPALTLAPTPRRHASVTHVVPTRLEQSHAGTRRVRPGVFVAAILVIAAGGALAVHQASTTKPNVSAAGTSAVYTTAMVQQMVAATRAAVAGSGMAQVTFTDTLADTQGVPLQTARGSSTFTFSGADLGLESQFTVVPGRQDGTTAYDSDTVRVVNGREYGLYEGRWYLLPEDDLGSSATTGLLQPDTDPRVFLQVLSPAARFRIVSREVVGGVELTHLSAANRNLAIRFQFHTTISQGEPNGNETITPLVQNWVMLVPALDVWVDGAGIVHRMDFTASMSTASVTTVPVTPRIGSNQAITQVVALSFSQLGQTEVITAPAHAKPTLPNCGYACIDNVYLTVPPNPEALPSS